MDLAARSINRTRPKRKKNETNIFPVRTEQASSIKFLLSWLYLEFLDGTAHLIGERVRYYKTRKFLLITPFLQNFCQNVRSDKKEKDAEMFPFEYLFKNTNQ